MKHYRRLEEEIDVVEWDGTTTAKTDLLRLFNGDRSQYYYRQFGTRLFIVRPGDDREIMRGENVTLNRSGMAYVISNQLLDEEFKEV